MLSNIKSSTDLFTNKKERLIPFAIYNFAVCLYKSKCIENSTEIYKTFYWNPKQIACYQQTYQTSTTQSKTESISQIGIPNKMAIATRLRI